MTVKITVELPLATTRGKLGSFILEKYRGGGLDLVGFSFEVEGEELVSCFPTASQIDEIVEFLQEIQEERKSETPRESADSGNDHSFEPLRDELYRRV